MAIKKRLADLTIKDNFMFCAVMLDEDNCRGFLERLFNIQIGKIEVSIEKILLYL